MDLANDGLSVVIKFIHTLLSPMTTGPVTKNGDSLLGLAVVEGNVAVINYLVSEYSVDVNGEPLRVFLACTV